MKVFRFGRVAILIVVMTCVCIFTMTVLCRSEDTQQNDISLRMAVNIHGDTNQYRFELLNNGNTNYYTSDFLVNDNRLVVVSMDGKEKDIFFYADNKGGKPVTVKPHESYTWEQNINKLMIMLQLDKGYYDVYWKVNNVKSNMIKVFCSPQ